MAVARKSPDSLLSLCSSLPYFRYSTHTCPFQPVMTITFRNYCKVSHWTAGLTAVGVNNSLEVKRDQLDVACFIISLFNAQHVSDVNTSILRSLRLICWVISCVVMLWLDVCWCYVVVWLWWCGIGMQAEALCAYGYHTTTAKPQRNTNTHRTRAIQPMK